MSSQAPRSFVPTADWSSVLTETAETCWRGARVLLEWGRRDIAVQRGLREEEVAGHQVAWLTDALYFQSRIDLDLCRPEAALDAWTLFTGRSSLQSKDLELWLASLGETHRVDVADGKYSLVWRAGQVPPLQVLRDDEQWHELEVPISSATSLREVDASRNLANRARDVVDGRVRADAAMPHLRRALRRTLIDAGPFASRRDAHAEHQGDLRWDT